MKPLAVTDLFERNQKKLDLIKNSSDGNYAKDLLPLLEQMARWFNSMPLNSQMYDEPGGAFRCCVESAYFVMRQAKDAIFTSELTSEKRRKLEPEFRYAAFIASLVSWCDEPFRHYEFIADGKTFNSSVDPDFSDFLRSHPGYVMKGRDGSLAPSRSRTVMLAAKIIVPYLDRLSAHVQDCLIAAINPDRRPQNSETVLQRTVRKGLAQAEEIERKSKGLFVVPVDRTVTTASMLEEVENNRTPQSSDESPTVRDAAPVAGATPASAPAPAAGLPSKRLDSQPTGKQSKTDDRQIDLLPKSTDDLKVPQQYHELFDLVASDIRSGKHNKELALWTASGLTVPKKFFAGYGKATTQYIDALRTHNVVIGLDTLNVLITPQFGEILLPRPPMVTP